ncbi:MAG: carbonic anhydrase [Amaricoccus sp.]
MEQDGKRRASRRELLRGVALLALSGAVFAGAPPLVLPAAADSRPAPEGKPQLTPDAALQEVMDGNARFVAGTSRAHEQDLAILKARAAEGQWPVVGILACADSRVPVEMVFDEPIGRLFVTRIAGNIATPEIIASLEYGVAVLGIKALVVMGHSDCGAVKSAIKNPEVPGQISALFPAILPAVYLSKTRELEDVVRTNATVQAATLMNASTVVEAAVKAGALKVVPAVYDVGTGKVELLSVPSMLRAG